MSFLFSVGLEDLTLARIAFGKCPERDRLETD